MGSSSGYCYIRIDDSSYRDKPYYPKDLVDYARIQYTSLDQQGNTMIKEYDNLFLIKKGCK